ncbi:uncharacterized protein V1516DRAFT_711411 [Lipomyces oligophaga]|uniref:uncharacterized protein n=1 Tax=Lipomyces oligophaga TaxID=45792 RepID=UPI0034CFDFA6
MSFVSRSVVQSNWWSILRRSVGPAARAGIVVGGDQISPIWMTERTVFYASNSKRKGRSRSARAARVAKPNMKSLSQSGDDNYFVDNMYITANSAHMWSTSESSRLYAARNTDLGRHELSVNSDRAKVFGAVTDLPAKSGLVQSPATSNFPVEIVSELTTATKQPQDVFVIGMLPEIVNAPNRVIVPISDTSLPCLQPIQEPSKVVAKEPSYLGLPSSFPTPDDSIVSEINKKKEPKLPSADNWAEKLIKSRKFGYVWYIGLVTGTFGFLVGTGGYLLLKLFEDQDGGFLAPGDRRVLGGGSKHQYHVYPVSTGIAVVVSSLFAIKIMVPSVRSTLVRYGYLHLRKLSTLIKGGKLNVPSAAIVMSQLSHHTLVSFIASTLCFVFLCRETEYLIAPSALAPVLAVGLTTSAISAAFVPVVLGGGNVRYLVSICGSSGLAYAVLGFLSSFDDSGDVIRYGTYLFGGASAFRVLSKSKDFTKATACCISALNIGGLLGGLLVGHVPDAVLFAKKALGYKTAVKWSAAYEGESEISAYRHAFWTKGG